MVGVGSVEIGIGPGRLQSDGLVVVFDGRTKILFRFVCIAAIEVGIGPTRIEANRLAEVADRPGIIVSGAKSQTPVVQGLGIGGIATKGLIVVPNGSIVLAQTIVNHASSRVPSGVIGV